jgi:hypothetical protein
MLINVHKPTLYFGYSEWITNDVNRYCFYHEIRKADILAKLGNGLSLERLAGYIEGAISGYSSELNLCNGIPQHYWGLLELNDIKPIPQETLVSIPEATGYDVVNLLTLSRALELARPRERA